MISNDASPNEPSICMDPANPNNIIAGANVNKYFFSTDGGNSWGSGTLTTPGFVVWGDPVIIVDTLGDFYFLHLSYEPGGPYIDRIYCQKYDFDNNTWSDGSYMGKNGDKAQDKEWAVVDRQTNNIYVTWTQFDKYGSTNPADSTNIMFSKSTDNGISWSDAIQINEVSGICVDSSLATEGAVPTVGPNGEIYVSWSGPAGIVFDKSLDQGETWLDNDILINEQPGGWYMDIPGINRVNGMPVTCCDISNSQYRGTIYVNWADKRNGLDDSDIFISKSEDGGITWSDALRVNDDPPGKNQFFTWMTIDQVSGDIYIIFYDRRNHNDWNTDVYIARSSDGGASFENIKISESPFLPNNVGFFGDYTNITAYDGKIRPIWARADGPQMSIWTAIIDQPVGNTDPLAQAPVSLEQNYPNPFNESTYLRYKVIRPSVVTLTVSDVYGRNVALLVNQEYVEPGKYLQQFVASEYGLPTGVYYYTLQVGNVVQNQKMILVD